MREPEVIDADFTVVGEDRWGPFRRWLAEKPAQFRRAGLQFLAFCVQMAIGTMILLLVRWINAETGFTARVAEWWG